jgi:hypothetical protein
MSTTQKYYVSQILAIPFVGLPTLIGGFLLGDLLSDRLMVDAGIFTHFLTLACMGGLGWITSRITGNALCGIGLLPPGAHRIYPKACSWRDYELKKASMTP